jgi:hypothetical protein
MNPEKIICPHCENEIPLTDLLTHQISESLRKEMESGLRQKEKSLAEKNEKFKAKEEALRKQAEDVDQLVESQLEEKLKAIQAAARAKAVKDSETELKILREELEEKSKKLSTSQEAEAKLRKQSRELEEREKALELEVEKKLAAEIDEAKQKAIKTFQEEQQLKDAAFEKKIADMAKAVDEAKRKAEQGSMQTQGEVAELRLEETLERAFRYDDIEPVAKGVRGADVIQTVKDQALKACGKIIWESKNTKSWSQGWIQKLKDDQTSNGAEIAILVSEAMPADIENFGMVDGVWVTRQSLAIPLATVLRDSLADLSYARNSAEGMNEKMQVLYKYITGPEFRQKVEGIIDTFSGMKNQLEREKRAMTKLWKERDKQIDRVVENTSGMYGDFKGVIGAALKDIDTLELTDGLSEDDSDE